MKHLMVLFVGLMCAFGASAQSSLIATLIHGDSISTFQSAEALKLAYDKAVDGDVITLSSGTFNAPSTISKGITIRGAGMMAYENATMNPTLISGSCVMRDVKEGSTQNIENVRFLGDVTIRSTSGLINFMKTRFYRVYAGVSGGTYSNLNLRMIHCILSNLYITTMASTSKVSIINSDVYWSGVSGNTGGFIYDNCIITLANTPVFDGLGIMHFRNCIIKSERSSTYLSSSSTASGCVYVGPATGFFKNCAPTLNKSFPKDTPIFKENTEVYELTDENKKNWLGTDGTQVGMHGGNLPFDPSVDAPMISKFNVASKTTADGKLSVEIEVKAD